MNVRKLDRTDYESIRSIWMSVPGIGVMSVDDSYEGLCRFLDRNPETCFAAEDNGTVIGSVLCGHDGRRAYVYHLAVDPAHQRMGVGKALVNAMLDALRAEGICKVALVAFAENESGKGFWTAMGFSERTDLSYLDLQLNKENIWTNRTDRTVR